MPPHSFSTITTGRKSQDPPSLLLQRPEPPSPPSLSNSTKQQRQSFGTIKIEIWILRRLVSSWWLMELQQEVCGYKAVIRFFPHHVSDLEPAVCLLEKCHGTTVGTALRQESTGEMETKCVILLWLSILVLVPFDISSVDTSIVNTQSVDANEPPPLVARILKISKEYLSSVGPMQTIAGFLLSKLLTRPDMRPSFTRILSSDLFFISHSSKHKSGKKSVAKKREHYKIKPRRIGGHLSSDRKVLERGDRERRKQKNRETLPDGRENDGSASDRNLLSEVAKVVLGGETTVTRRIRR
ncbi:hypothetical protein E3N88_41945 [Mikania micrantha]|uniref:Uncharacterized protein n=1 Tax=Mikania micrantha TaxID=192012 RepID=A0A5N6LJB0_9ASTR|nr:hypothetical protein E3N88_41945 [Mikania micrantha]